MISLTEGGVVKMEKLAKFGGLKERTDGEETNYEGIFQVSRTEGNVKYKELNLKQIQEDCPQTTSVKIGTGRDSLEIKVDPYESKNIVYEIIASSIEGRNKLVGILKDLCEQEPKYTPFTVERKEIAYIEEGTLEKKEETLEEERENDSIIEMYIKTGREGCIPCFGHGVDYDCDKCKEYFEKHKEIYQEPVDDKFTTPFWKNPQHCEKYGMPKPASYYRYLSGESWDPVYHAAKPCMDNIHNAFMEKFIEKGYIEVDEYGFITKIDMDKIKEAYDKVNKGIIDKAIQDEAVEDFLSECKKSKGDKNE